jgi:hypothetical protein
MSVDVHEHNTLNHGPSRTPRATAQHDVATGSMALILAITHRHYRLAISAAVASASMFAAPATPARYSSLLVSGGVRLRS